MDRGPDGQHPGSLDDGDDRDVARSLRFLLRFLLGASMLAIAGVELLNLHLHLFGRAAQPQKPPAPPAFPHGTKFPKASGAGGGAALHVPLRPILYALLILALLGLLVFSVWLARRARRASLPAAVPDDITEDPAELLEAVASGRAAMASLDDARAAIIACYAAMEAHLAGRGAARGAADTPTSSCAGRWTRASCWAGLAEAVATTVPPDGSRLFYEARFSTHELSRDAREAALAALDDLTAELADAVASRLMSERGQRAGDTVSQWRRARPEVITAATLAAVAALAGLAVAGWPGLAVVATVTAAATLLVVGRTSPAPRPPRPPGRQPSPTARASARSPGTPSAGSSSPPGSRVVPSMRQTCAPCWSTCSPPG